MTIKEDLSAAYTKTGCKVCNALSTLDEDEHTQVSDALRKNHVVNGKVVYVIGHKKLADILTKNGHPLSESAIRRHRDRHTKVNT